MVIAPAGNASRIFMLAGALIDRVGFISTIAIYCSIGISVSLLIAYRWRSELWHVDGAANLRS